MFASLGMRETLCVVPDVSGNTGMEAAEITSGAAQSAHPSFIVAVDALASRRLSRLATTVQICDTGISPVRESTTPGVHLTAKHSAYRSLPSEFRQW